jgi:hypothetical protein
MSRTQIPSTCEPQPGPPLDEAAKPARWLTWDAWMDIQRQRIFAEAAALRTKPEPARTLNFARTKEPIEQTQLEDKNRRNHAK